MKNNMLRAVLTVCLMAVLLPVAYGQSVYPTPQGRITVPATVPLQCNASAANCQPVSAANPVPQSATGNVASGAADSGNPVKVGGVFNTTQPTLTTGQRGDLQLDARANVSVYISGKGTNSGAAVVTPADGGGASGGLATFSQNMAFNGSTWDRMRGDANGLVVQPGLSSTYWNYAAASGGIVNTTTAVTIKAAAGASVRNYVCWLHIVHDTLGGATEVALRDGAAGTVMWRGRLQTAATDSSFGAGTLTFSPCLRGTANTLVEFVTLTAVTGGVYVDAGGTTGI